jgi:hypothetical protein
MSLPGRVKRRREPIYLRVVKGGFEPSSDYYAKMLRTKGLKVGDLVRAELTKPRNPRHHALVMSLLHRVLQNQDGLLTIDQLLTVLKIKLGRCAPYIDAASGKTYFVVESIAFDAMDQGEFETFWKDLCNVIARDYFPGMAPDLVGEMASMMAEP